MPNDEVFQSIAVKELHVSELDARSVNGTIKGGLISLGEDSEVTISSGAITVTQSYHNVDTEADAASDDLTTINGGVTGQILVLRSNNSGRDIVLKDGGGNLTLSGDFTLAGNNDTIMLILKSNGYWSEISAMTN